MQGKIDKLKRVRVVGDFFMLGTFFMLVGVFLSAYLSSDYRSTINVNFYGEAHVEMIVLLFILMPISLATVILSFLDWKGTWKAKGMILSHDQLHLDAFHFYQFQSNIFLCPTCQIIFGTGEPDYEEIITCPSCGLRSSINASPLNSEDGMDQMPRVRVIKDIRIENKYDDVQFTSYRN